MSRTKLAHSSVDTDTKSGEIEFIAARNVQNLNGWTYDVKSLQAQDANGDYHILTDEPIAVSIPLMVDHSDSTKDKIGNIDSAHIAHVAGVDEVIMHANFFDTETAQEVHGRVLKNELTDVSITTDWGDGDVDSDLLTNSHIIEVSIVYAGAEPKAKILAKNAVTDDAAEPEGEQAAEPEPQPAEALTAKPDESQKQEVQVKTIKLENNEMPRQETTHTVEQKVANKSAVLNSLKKLAENGSLRKMNRQQVVEAIKNDINITLPDGETPYTVPDALFTEIIAATRPTDILSTFRSVPARRYTLLNEQYSDANLARAGRWTKGQQKQIQQSDLRAQKFSTDFIYKLQQLSYEDLNDDFGSLLWDFIVNELPQKASEEEERAFIVGDGREANDERHIRAIYSLDEAAQNDDDLHVFNYDGSGDTSALAAVLNGTSKLEEDGTTYAVLNKSTLASFRAAGLETATGLPFSVDTVAGAFGVSSLFTRSYVPTGVVFVYTGEFVYRLTGGTTGETIEQYDIDYNNRKIEFIRRAGGAAAGLYSAVKISLPQAISA